MMASEQAKSLSHRFSIETNKSDVRHPPFFSWSFRSETPL